MNLKYVSKFDNTKEEINGFNLISEFKDDFGVKTYVLQNATGDLKYIKERIKEESK